MTDLPTVVTHLDAYLCVREVRDYPEALNGLQVANSGKTSRIGAAVDLCQATIRQAHESGVDLMLVHHGLFWGGLRPLTGTHYQRVSELLQSDIAVYSSHLPLDCHPTVGNAAILAKMLDVRSDAAFPDRNGQAVGISGSIDATRDDLSRRLAAALGGPARLLPFGPERVQRIGIVTGSGGSLLRAAAALGLDTFITGEGAHHTYFDAEELGVNLYFGGHYRTETFGVKALATYLSDTFKIPWTFLDHPTGM
jgi:dinuclear metal center YbgI/SA1388 family protein